MDIKKLMDELISKLNGWGREYYDNDMPTVSDEMYDAALFELKRLESKYPHFIQKNSPTQKVGGNVKKGFKKEKHKSRMLSLSNAFNKNDLVKFADNIKKYSDDEKFSCEPKIDGLSIALIYQDGKLVQAVTRGDGKIGEVVTDNASTILDIPQVIKYKNNLEVRGEIYISNDNFTLINKTLQQSGKPLLANARNAASGAMRQLDANITRERKLSSFIYTIPDPKKHNLNSQSEILEFLRLQSFAVPEESKIVKTIEDVWNYIENMIQNRGKLNYEIDGVVVKFNNATVWDQIGYTVKAPKWSIAYKLPSEIVETKLNDIEITIGRTGRVTYNARLEPVRLAGTIVSNATLHNYDYIYELDIRIDDLVKVKKAGDIIPKVMASIKKEKRKNRFQKITICPYCNHSLKQHSGEVDQYCTNDSCSEILAQSIAHFVSRGAMDIVGLGPKVVKILIKNKIINNIWDIFKIDSFKKKFISIRGLGNESYLNLVNSINISKKKSLDKLLFALGIRHVGQKASYIIARRYKNMSTIASLGYDELSSNDEIGTKIAQSLVDYFKKNKSILDSIKLANINDSYISEDEVENIFTGKTVVITGTLNRPRNIYKDILKKSLAKISSTVSNKTDYLLCGENPGSKLSKAKKLDVKIISEKDFTDLLEVNNG